MLGQYIAENTDRRVCDVVGYNAHSTGRNLAEGRVAKAELFE